MTDTPGLATKCSYRTESKVAFSILTEVRIVELSSLMGSRFSIQGLDITLLRRIQTKKKTVIEINMDNEGTRS